MKEFSAFYEATYIAFQKFLIVKAPSLDRVDDLLQEAYFRVYKQMKRKKILDLKAYLFQVGWNLLKKEYKLKQELSLEEVTFKSQANTESEILEKMELEELWNFVKKKEIVIQKCIYLYYLGMSLEEIANVLHLSLSNVKNYLYRTFKEIKEEF